MPRDLLVPHARDTEVWLGFELTGWLARLTAPLHWWIFAAGAWGFWRARPWVVPAAAAYVFYVALSHIVWSETSSNGKGLATGLLQAAVISIPGVALLWLHSRRRPEPPPAA